MLAARPSTAAKTSPENIPAVFVRAWNDRDPNALASFFDEEAEFVHVNGVWARPRVHTKGSRIRLERISHTSTLATDATKVELLSSDIAVVHARMTLARLGARRLEDEVQRTVNKEDMGGIGTSGMRVKGRR